MKLKKRRRSGRRRGSRMHGYSAKKHRGKGTRGGKGISGRGKRGAQKKTYVLRYFGKDYYGKEGLKTRKTKLKEINLRDIEKNLEKYGKKGKDGWEINLPDYKILGEGEVKEKLIIKAAKFSNKAREKIEKAGGKIVEKKES